MLRSDLAWLRVSSCQIWELRVGALTHNSFPLGTPKGISEDGGMIFSVTSSTWKPLILDWSLPLKFDVIPYEQPEETFKCTLLRDVEMVLDPISHNPFEDVAILI